MDESMRGGGARRIGRPSGPAGVTVREAAGLGLLDLIAGRHRVAALAAAVRQTFAVELPGPGRAVTSGEATFLRVAPLRWQVQAENPPTGWAASLRAACGEAAAVVDQSDSRRHFDLGGPRVRDALAKGLPLDLHAETFRIGDVATTAVGHVGVTIRRIGVEPAFRIGVAQSYAYSFLDWLLASAAEFGCDADC